MNSMLRKYATSNVLMVDRLNRLEALWTWANDQAGIALAAGNTPRFMHHYHRVNKLQLEIQRSQEKLDGTR